jgi:hypothetical protein
MEACFSPAMTPIVRSPAEYATKVPLASIVPTSYDVNHCIDTSTALSSLS